jgi:hypothetical protein
MHLSAAFIRDRLKAFSHVTTAGSVLLMPWAHGCVLSYCEWIYTVSLHHQLLLVCGLNLQGTDGLGQRSLKGRWSSVGCPSGRLAAQITTCQVLVVKMCTPAREVCLVASLITAGCHHSAETVLCFITDWSIQPSKLNGLWNTHWRCYAFVVTVLWSVRHRLSF